MKKFFFSSVITVIVSSISAQNVGIGTTTPNASAALEIKATDKGLLIPRISTASRNAIGNPAKGLMVYDTTTSSIWYHNGSAWTNLSGGSSGVGWSLTGNAGTTPNTNFIGTTDAKSLEFKVNKLRAGLIDYSTFNTGTRNTAYGQIALYSNTTGMENTASGYGALYSNQTGNDNSAYGKYALFTNTQGSYNTALGYNSMFFNTTGTNNTATGTAALQNNTNGTSNTAHGMYGLYSNQTGNQNIASGYKALYSNISGSYNSAHGAGALNNNTGGVWNTANGAYALYSGTTGDHNTATGGESLYTNTAFDNTADGYRALYSNTTGNGNTAAGYEALFSNETGSTNTALGFFALFENTTGSNNLAVGSSALFNNETGSQNTASGHDALFYNRTGSYNTGLGYHAGPLKDNLVNATAIGYAARVGASNSVQIGSTDVSSIGGQVGWSSFSDGRYKQNIKQDVHGLDFINSLQPVTYTVDINRLDIYYDKGIKQDSAFLKMKSVMRSSTDKASRIIYSGFIAQDVEKAAQAIGYNFSGVDKPQTKEGLYGLRYGDFVVPLVKAVQEQQQQIEVLKQQNELLLKEIQLIKEKRKKL